MSKGPSALLLEILLSRPWQRVLLIALSALATCCGLLSAFFQKEFVDSLLGNAMVFASLNWHPMVWLLSGFLALLLSLSLAQAVNAIGNREAIWMQRHLAERLYRNVLSLQPSQLRGRTVGEIVAIYTTDIPGCTILLEQSLPQGFSIAFPLILAPVVLISFFGLSQTFVGVVLGFLVVINFILAQRQSQFFFTFKQLAAQRMGLVNEWIQNLRTLRILSWVELFEKKIITVRENETQNRIRMLTNGQTMNAIAASVTFFLNFIFVNMLVEFHPERVTPGTLLALLWIVAIFLTRPFRQLPWFFTFVFDGWTSLKRVQSYLELTATHIDALSSPEVSVEAAVQVRNLNLRVDQHVLLKDIDFDIKREEFVAFVGEVGSGKTQLLLSLLGETPATFSDYKVLGQPVARMRDNELRTHFSFVPQEGFVISATLRENVVFDYNDGLQDSAKVRESLIRCEFDPTTELSGVNLETEIGERGVNLSGGQRQRVSLARVDYHDAPIVLLDDCFSALDVDTEEKLIATLFEKAWKKKTRVLVTHRLTVLDKVDRIFFMREGQISAVGTWDELMRSSPEFVEFTQTVSLQQPTTEAASPVQEESFAEK